MKKTLTVCLSAALAAFIAMPAAAQEQQPDFSKMFQAMMGAAAQGENAPAAELVNFRDLKALLPAELDGMKRVEASGEKSGVAGMSVSSAKGIYKGDKGQITIEFSDLGGTGFAGLAQMGFAAAEIDRETEHGYERTVKFDGHPGKEKYDSKTERGEISAFIGKRISAKVDGYNVSDEALHKAFKSIDLKKLTELVKKAEKGGEKAADKETK